MKNYIKESEENLQKQLQDEKRVGGVRSYASGVIPNPRFYKYLWQIYICPPIDWQQKKDEETVKESRSHRRAKYSNDASEKHKVFSMPTICFAEFMKRIEWLRENRIECVVSNIQIPRRDPSIPWDYDAEKWKGVKFAPSLDEDTDELAPNGHR